MDDPIRLPITDVFDLHSVPARDVQEVVEEYLSEAHRLGYKALRIIHGRGIGVQRPPKPLDGAPLSSRCGEIWYPMRMKRTNLVLDERLLSEATRVLGAKTYSGAVNTALEEVIRLKKIQGLSQFFGSGVWEGDLAEMREDNPRPARRPR